METEIDFTACPHVPGRAYNGANGKKVAIRFENDVWMLKFPPNVRAKPTTLSYSNSCYSEHVASSVFRMLGIPAQETRLGTHANGTVKVVCACRDFTTDGRVLLDFCSIKNTVIDSETNGPGTDLQEMLETIELQQFVDPVRLRDFFWDMFVADALLGNFDRHNGNWGFLADRESGKTEIAPVFDCGSCLLPQADESVMRKVIEDPAECDARIKVFPASAIKIGDRKINYVEFIRNGANPDLNAAISRIVPRIDIRAICAFIRGVPYLTDLQRDFYCHYLTARNRALFA